MKKDEFINRVEYLLSDISSEEKIDAINYYRDYLEEAGADKEEEVLRGFGSPERIAAIIRADITGNMNDGGEFTENGYKDPRFDEPENNIVVSDAKKDNAKKDNANKDNKEKDNTKKGFKEKLNNMFGENMSKTTKIVLIVLLVILLFPVLFGTGTFLLASLGHALGFVISLLFLVGIVTLGLFIGTVVLLFSAFGFVFVNGGVAAFLFGAALTIFGLGLFALVLSVLFYGKFIPFLYRKIKGFFTRKEE